jgi:hypothetical protein
MRYPASALSHGQGKLINGITGNLRNTSSYKLYLKVFKISINVPEGGSRPETPLSDKNAVSLMYSLKNDELFLFYQ